MGADGHIASLFPGDPVLDEEAVAVAPVHTPHAGFRRVTLTLPVLNAARRIFYLVSGEGKAAAVARVCRDQDPSLAATRVRPETGSLAWFIDAAAAGLLTGR
jgi:6-phosphogluconolactonase